MVRICPMLKYWTELRAPELYDLPKLTHHLSAQALIQETTLNCFTPLNSSLTSAGGKVVHFSFLPKGLDALFHC